MALSPKFQSPRLCFYCPEGLMSTCGGIRGNLTPDWINASFLARLISYRATFSSMLR